MVDYSFLMSNCVDILYEIDAEMSLWAEPEWSWRDGLTQTLHFCQ